MSEERIFDEDVTYAEDEVVEEPKKGLLTRAAIRLKNHGKAIAAGAVVLTVGLIGYGLGSKSKDSEIDELESTDLYKLEDHSEPLGETEE